MEKEKLYPLLLNKLESIRDDKNSIENQEGPFYKNRIRVIISFKTNEDRDNFLTQRKNIKFKKKFEIIPSITSSLSIKKIKKLTENKLIKQIEEDQKLFLNVYDLIQELNLIDFKGSQFSFTGKRVNIGIIDTKIQSFYESFYQSKINVGYEKQGNNLNKNYIDRDQVSHGTITANLITNQLKSKEGFRLGVAPDAKIYDLSLSYKNENYYFSDILSIFDKIIKNQIPLDILLISFSSSEPSSGNDILSRGCNIIVKENNIHLVVPAGNLGSELGTITSPGAALEVITVGSISDDGKISHFSGRESKPLENNKPDIYLRGEEVEIKLEKKNSIKVSGTSISAAIATGIIALLKEYDKNLTTKQIKELFNKHHGDFGGNIDIIKLFSEFGIFSPKLVSYKYLLKRSLWVSIQILIILIALFFWQEIYNIVRLIYGF